MATQQTTTEAQLQELLATYGFRLAGSSEESGGGEATYEHPTGTEVRTSPQAITLRTRQGQPVELPADAPRSEVEEALVTTLFQGRLEEAGDGESEFEREARAFAYVANQAGNHGRSLEVRPVAGGVVLVQSGLVARVYNLPEGTEIRSLVARLGKDRLEHVLQEFRAPSLGHD